MTLLVYIVLHFSNPPFVHPTYPWTPSHRSRVFLLSAHLHRRFPPLPVYSFLWLDSERPLGARNCSLTYCIIRRIEASNRDNQSNDASNTNHIMMSILAASPPPHLLSALPTQCHANPRLMVIIGLCSPSESTPDSYIRSRSRFPYLQSIPTHPSRLSNRTEAHVRPRCQPRRILSPSLKAKWLCHAVRPQVSSYKYITRIYSEFVQRCGRDAERYETGNA